MGEHKSYELWIFPPSHCTWIMLQTCCTCLLDVLTWLERLWDANRLFCHICQIWLVLFFIDANAYNRFQMRETESMWKKEKKKPFWERLPCNWNTSELRERNSVRQVAALELFWMKNSQTLWPSSYWLINHIQLEPLRRHRGRLNFSYRVQVNMQSHASTSIRLRRHKVSLFTDAIKWWARQTRSHKRSSFFFFVFWPRNQNRRRSFFWKIILDFFFFTRYRWIGLP